MSNTDEKPGKGFLGWLGRQVGYVKGAVKKDVTTQKLYESKTVEEAPHPGKPNVVLRRTVIDEAIQRKD